ncbi:hypothetical protein SAMN05192561_11275, partial [Halopenitus malekzadehii]
GTGPNVREAATELPGEIVAGLNSLGRWKYLVPLVGPLMGAHELITGAGPDVREAASELPGNIIAGLNSLGKWKYLVPLVGPLMAARDMISNPQKWISAGEQIPTMVARGIKRMATSPVDAVTDVASGIRDRLPFSPAAAGPLQSLDETGPALVQTIASGIEGEQGELVSSVSSVLAATPAGQGVQALGGLMSKTPAGMVAGAAADAIGGQASGGGGGQTIDITVTNNITIDGSGSPENSVEQAAQQGTSTALEEFFDRLARET